MLKFEVSSLKNAPRHLKSHKKLPRNGNNLVIRKKKNLKKLHDLHTATLWIRNYNGLAIIPNLRKKRLK